MGKRIALVLAMAALVLSMAFGAQYPDAERFAQIRDNAQVTVWFIDVGQADFILIGSGGRYMAIDGGNVADGQKVYSVLRSLVPGNEVDIYMGTHAHEDHMGAAASVLSAVRATAIWCPRDASGQKFFSSFLRKAADQGRQPYCPSVGTVHELGNCSVLVLGPRSPLPEQENDASLAVKVTCKDVSFVMAGDSEYEGEKYLAETWGEGLQADVLKVSHHGSDSSSIYSFLRAVQPRLAVVSVGKDNAYGHPGDGAMSRLSDAGATVLRTDVAGDIVVYSDGKDIAWETARGSATGNVADQRPRVGATYIGNRNSKVFHSQSCTALPDQRNRVALTSRQLALDEGYTPCGRCKP